MKAVYPIALVATVATAVLTMPHPVKGEFDYVGLNNQVQHHQEVLDNHEARINNLESDVKVIQVVTQAEPAPKQEVPVVAPVTPAEPENPEPPRDNNIKICMDQHGQITCPSS